MLRWASVGAVLLLGWWLTAIVVGNEFALVGPGPTLIALTDRWELIVPATAETMGFSIAAFGFSMLVTILLLLVVAFAPPLKEVTMPVLVFFRSAPVVVMAPIIHSISGGDADQTRFWIGVLLGIFPMTVIPLREMDMVPRELRDTAAAMGATALVMRMHLSLPWSFSAFLHGLRTAASLSVVGVVVAELVYPVGVGRVFVTAGAQQDTDLVIAALLTVSVAAYLWTLAVDLTATYLHRRFYALEASNDV